MGSYTPFLAHVCSQLFPGMPGHTIPMLCQTAVVTALTRACSQARCFPVPSTMEACADQPDSLRPPLGALGSALQEFSEWNCVCPEVLAVGALHKALRCCAHRAWVQVSSPAFPPRYCQAVPCPKASSLSVCWPLTTSTSRPCDGVARPLSEGAEGPDLIPLTTILPCFQLPSDTMCFSTASVDISGISLSPCSYTRRKALL